MDVHHTFIFYNYSRKEKNIAPQIALHVSVELINNRNKPIAPRDQACISHGWERPLRSKLSRKTSANNMRC